MPKPTHEIVVLEGAERHIQEVFSLLEGRKEGSGLEFYDSYLMACDLLKRHPLIGRRVRPHIRKWSMLRWHMGVFYTVSGRRVMIVGVMDLRQDPTQIDRWLEQF